MVETKQRMPRTAPPKVRRKQLIDATITSISKHGMAGTTMTSVTKLAGLSVGLANFHFNSKDVLLEETLRYLATEHRDHWMKQITQPGLSAAEKVSAIIRAQFDPRICSRKKLTVWFAFFGEAAYRSSYRAITKQIDTERFEVIEALFTEIISQEGGDLVPAGVAQTIESLFDGFWLNMLMYPEANDAQGAKAQVFVYLKSSFPMNFDATPA